MLSSRRMSEYQIVPASESLPLLHSPHVKFIAYASQFLVTKSVHPEICIHADNQAQLYMQAYRQTGEANALRGPKYALIMNLAFSFASYSRTMCYLHCYRCYHPFCKLAHERRTTPSRVIFSLTSVAQQGILLLRISSLSFFALV